MRVGVVDIGSNTVRLQIIDATPGGPPLPTHGRKWALRLAEHVGEDGVIKSAGASSLKAVLGEVLGEARHQEADELLVFATAALRDAPNAHVLVSDVKSSMGVAITILSGEEEARFTFLAARRWLGWRAGSLLVVDIGGGSLEVARGRDERPEVAVSLPLGAGRLARTWLRCDPPTADAVREVRHHVRDTVRQVADRLRWEGEPATAVATSSTFRHLARLAGAPPRRKGPFAPRSLTHRDARQIAKRLAKLSAAKRADLPGISSGKVTQITAGAIVADVVMSALDLRSVEISPWALREGILLQRLDQLTDSGALHAGALITHATHDLELDADGRSAPPTTRASTRLQPL